MGHEYTALVTIIAIVIVLVFMFRVGAARGKYKVKAPKMAGQEVFDKQFRIHANTVEQAVIFFPALWLASFTAGDVLAASIGAVWIIGRLIYAPAYLKNPEGRAPGMLLTFGSTAFLAGLSLYEVLSSLLA